MKLLKICATALSVLLCGQVLAEKTAGQMVDDSVIQAKVKAEIMKQDLVTGGWDINLETRKGVVQLGGFIDDTAKGKQAADRAASVEGVVEVDNQLYQRAASRSAGQIADDGITTTRVKSAIAGVDLGKAAKINVDTNAGVVLLTGFVDSAEDKAEAESIAARDKNTKKVINGIYVLD